MKKSLLVLVLILFGFCASFFLAGSNPVQKEMNGRIQSAFEPELITINLQGNSGDGSPVIYTLELQPAAGYAELIFPVRVGAEEITIPEQPIRMPPLFPGMINGPGGPFAVRNISGPDTSGNALNFTATLPETTVNLQQPVSQAGGVYSAAVSPELVIDMPPIAFSVTEIEPTPSPIPIPYPNITIASSIHIKEIKIAIVDPGTSFYHGQLQYSLNVDNSGSAAPWSWSVSGVWDVSISRFPSSSWLAQLRHTRTANLAGGALLNASDPANPTIADLSVENLGTGGGQHPSFNIQFTRQKPGLNHTLTFRDPVMNKTNTQPFTNVAFIALGQWMRKMGDTSLKIKAPYTGNTPVMWTISISPNQNMTLSWIME